MNIFGREVGGGGKPKKPLQLVQRGTDTRIPIELVAQPSGEVLDLARFERLNVKVFNDAGTDATPPTDIQDNHLIVEVTADISQRLGTGVYSVEVTGRVADTAFADGYHDYTVRTTLCRVTSDGSDATPTKVTASVLEGLRGEKGKSAYESYVDTTTDDPKLTEKEWATLNATTTQFLYRINKGKEAPMNEQTLSADQLMELDKHRRALIEAIQAKGVSISDTDGLETLAEKVRAIEATVFTISKDGQFHGWSDETLPPMKVREGQLSLMNCFRECKSLTAIPYIQRLDRVSTFLYFAADCHILREATLPDLSRAVNLSGAFYRCTSLTTATIGALPRAKEFSSIFSRCTSLTTATIGAAPMATNLAEAFYGCTNLESVTLDFSGGMVNNFTRIFCNCERLRTVNGVIDISKTSEIGHSINDDFSGCVALKEVRIKGLKVFLDLTDCHNLSMESVRYLVENAQTVNNRIIELSSKLLDSHKEELDALGTVASGKGFTFNYR